MALCSSVTAVAAVPSPSDRFAQLRANDLRVATVAYRLAITNRKLCAPALTPQSGFVLHSIAQYELVDRDEAAARLGLGQHVGVMAVVDGSPAQKAGLQAGDQLLSINGRALAKIAIDGKPSRAPVDAVQRMLSGAMQAGTVTLRVSSPQGERTVSFAAELGCPSNAEFDTGDDVNAWADGSRVMISAGLLRRCATDDDLALVVAHEMAHNVLHHRARLAAMRTANGTALSAERIAAEFRATEVDADRLGVLLVGGAGYDLSGAPGFVAGLTSPAVAVARTHPELSRRLSLLRIAIADASRSNAIAAPQRAEGVPAAAPRSANTVSSALVSGRI